VRIVPLYWLATILVIVGAWYTKNAVPKTVIVLESLFFYPFFTGPPVLLAGWTLNFEMMFYAIFALALVMRPRSAVIAASTTLVTLVILGWMLGPVGPNNVAFPLSLEFIFGMTIGLAYCEGARVGKTLGAVAIILGFLAMGFSQKLGLISTGSDPRLVLVWSVPAAFLVWGVPAAFVVAGATLAQWSWRPCLSRPAVLLGNTSYALYLFHLPLIMILAALGYGRSSWPIVIASCIVASISIHFVIERPILVWFRSKPPESSPGIKRDVRTVWSARATNLRWSSLIGARACEPAARKTTLGVLRRPNISASGSLP
jgi:exopolysaccharide production protein ExoZ